MDYGKRGRKRLWMGAKSMQSQFVTVADLALKVEHLWRKIEEKAMNVCYIGRSQKSAKENKS